MTTPADRPGKPIVVIGLLGPMLDTGSGPQRWGKWRPTVSIFQREDVIISRLELLTGPRHRTLAQHITADIRGLSPETIIETRDVETADPWDFEEVYGALLDFARAYPFRPDEEEYWIHLTTGTHVAQICLFLLTESGFIPGKLLQTSPPRDGVAAALQVIDLDLARYDRIAERFAEHRREGQGLLKAGIETKNEDFNRLIERIERVAEASDSPMLLTGPTGAGKTRLARQIYELKRTRGRVSGPFVEVNCATLRGDTAMSALFGHIRGAFTGAEAERRGLLREAHGGVLFLDEIGELGTDEQAVLLRAVEDWRFRPVGSDREVESKFQLIAGTNRDLPIAAAEGRFREDLLARIDLWTFRLPGLAERPQDIAPNLDYEIEQFAKRSGRRVRFNREARDRFLAFAVSPSASWPANFRDLNAAVTRMATLATGGRIDEAGVTEEIGRLRAAWGAGSAKAPARPDLVSALFGADGAGAIDRFDRVQLEDVLAVCRSSRTLSDAGRALFAASRAKKTSTNDADRLRKYLARFALKWEDLGGKL